MTPLAAISVLAALVAAPVAGEVRSTVTPDGAIRLWTGEKVTVRVGPDGKPVLVEAEAIDQAQAAPPKPGQGTFADPPQGALVLLLGREGERLHLKLESGVVRAFDYTGQFLAGGQTRPAKVCTALPLMANYETWAAAGAGAEAIELSNLRFRDTNEVVCSGPDETK